MPAYVLRFYVREVLPVYRIQLRPQDAADDQSVVDVAIVPQLEGWINFLQSTQVKRDNVVTDNLLSLLHHLQPTGDGPISWLICAAIDGSFVDVTQHKRMNPVQPGQEIVRLRINYETHKFFLYWINRTSCKA